MNNNTNLHEQIIDLQSRLAHQEDLLAELNRLCFVQDERVRQLEEQNRVLIEHVRELLEAQEQKTPNERPPHY